MAVIYDFIYYKKIFMLLSSYSFNGVESLSLFGLAAFKQFGGELP